MDIFRIAEGNMSILGVMIGDDYNEQRDRLKKEGMTHETWVLNKGSILIKPETGVYTRYLKEATITLEGICLNKIIFQAEFSSYPNDVVDSFLGITKELEKFGLPVIKPNWQVLDDRIVNLYRTHNVLWEINVTILGQGETSISLELSANITDSNFQIAEDAVGIYKSLSKLSRRIWQLEDSCHKSGTIFF